MQAREPPLRSWFVKTNLLAVVEKLCGLAVNCSMLMVDKEQCCFVASSKVEII